MIERCLPEAEKAAAAHGCELWDIEFVKEAGQQILRLYIDKPAGGIGTDDCEAVSRTFEAWLDEDDPIPDSYMLEVSSAGLTRALKRPEDFPRYFGHRVDVRLYKGEHGAKDHTGLLKAYSAEALTLDIQGNELVFTVKNISLVRLNPIL